MMRILRRILAGFTVLVLLLAGAFAWFLYAPAPAVPRLSGSIQRDSIRVGGRTRSYAFYVPARLAPHPPLVLALHSSLGNAEEMRQATAYGFERLADRYGFVVLYPEGYEGHWDDCRKKGPYAAKRLGIDDVGFMRALVARFRSAYAVDPARVFAVGLSNGGHFSYRLALEAPDLVRAVAAVAANVPAPENMDCTPAPGAASVLIMNGTGDPINPYEGGKVTLFGFGNRGNVLSARQSAAYFARRNGIAAAPGTESIAQPAGSGPTWAERTTWRSAGRGEVVLYTIHGGGHTIPQPHVRFRRLLGRTHRALDGPAEIWSFFARQGARPSPCTPAPGGEPGSNDACRWRGDRRGHG
jgi:polyhydroxybutyrate depolymerase